MVRQLLQYEAMGVGQLYSVVLAKEQCVSEWASIETGQCYPGGNDQEIDAFWSLTWSFPVTETVISLAGLNVPSAVKNVIDESMTIVVSGSTVYRLQLALNQINATLMRINVVNSGQTFKTDKILSMTERPPS